VGSYDLAAAFLMTLVWLMGVFAATTLYGVAGFVGMWLFIAAIFLATTRRADN